MRMISAGILAATLFANCAFAAPPAPGKPAGLKEAQSEPGTALLIAGVGVVGLGIGLVVSAGDAGNKISTTTNLPTTTTTTTTTGTSP